MSDEKAAASSTAEIEKDATGTGSASANGSSADKAEYGDKQRESEKSVPYARFQEVYGQLKQAEKLINYFQENFDSPEDVKKAADVLKQLKSGDKGRSDVELTGEQKALLREAMRASVPELFDTLEKVREKSQATDEELNDILVDETTDSIAALVEAKGLPNDDEFVDLFGKQLFLVITSDPDLWKRWQRGRGVDKIVQQAYETMDKRMLSKLRKSGAVSDLKLKRTVAKLPSLPRGGSGATEKPKEPPKGEGMTTATHKRAWDHLMSLKEE